MQLAISGQRTPPKTSAPGTGGPAMSTGSIASDAEDVDQGQRRTTRKPDQTSYSERCRENEEESDTGKARAQGQGQLSKAFPQRESRQGQRNAANARERARMRVLSRGFSRLKTSLPWVPADTKLSKLDTLRLASSYISHLRQLLQDERFEHSFVHPVNLTWPFVMSGRLEDHQDHNMSSPGRTLCGASA